MSFRWINLLYVLLIFIVVVTMPVFVNFLMINEEWKVIGDEETWIGFHGSFLGGVVSGALTLVGVLLTLSFNKKQEFIKEYPKLRYQLNIVIKQFSYFIEEMEIVLGYQEYDVMMYHTSKLLDETEEIEKNSTVLGGDFFESISSFLKISKGINKYLEKNVFAERSGVNSDFVDDMELDQKLMMLKLTLKDLKSMSKKLDRNYNKVTGLRLLNPYKREIRKIHKEDTRIKE